MLKTVYFLYAITPNLKINYDIKFNKSFFELGEKKTSHHQWPELEKLILVLQNYFKNTNNTQKITIIVPSLNNLIYNKRFCELFNKILEYPIKLKILNLPDVNQNNFKQYTDNLILERQAHGRKIKTGLIRSKAKSGNPNAKTQIKQINHQKTINAICFSLMFARVIYYLKTKNFSQRHILEYLNNHGFYAPEGGKWVLSQLQKQLVNINNLPTLISNNQFELANMVKFNQFILDNISIIQNYHFDNLNLCPIVNNNSELQKSILNSFKLAAIYKNNFSRNLDYANYKDPYSYLELAKQFSILSKYTDNFFTHSMRKNLRFNI